MTVEVPPIITCPECHDSHPNCDEEGACVCLYCNRRFWDTESWEWKTLRRAQRAESAAQQFAGALDEARRTIKREFGPDPLKPWEFIDELLEKYPEFL